MKSLSKSLLESLLLGLPEGVMVVARHGEDWQAVFFNPAFGELARLSPGELSGQNLKKILHATGGRDDWPRLARALADRQPIYLTVYPGTPDEPGAPLSLCVTPLNASEGREYAACHLSLRQGEAQAADGPPSPSETLPATQRRDAATGLAPRPFFDGVLSHDWALARREGHRLSLLVFRIQAFRAYLDTFGRHATESMIRRVARCITRRLRRASDIASRLEEDCVVALVHGGDEAAVRAFADSITRQVGDLGIHHPHSPLGRFVTVHCTVTAALPETGQDANDFVMQALAQGSSAEH